MTYTPTFSDSFTGPGRFLLVPRLGASVVLSVPGWKGPVEIPYNEVLWLRIREGETVSVISGYPELVQFSRAEDAEPQHVPYFLEPGQEQL